MVDGDWDSGNGPCAGCRAVLDAAERLILEPGVWMVKKDGDQTTLYAVVGPSVHEIRGECKPAPDDPDQPDTGKCDYRMMRLTGEATFRCEIVRTERRDLPAKTRTNWCFKLNREDEIEVTSEPDDRKRDLVEGFAQALVTEISHLDALATAAQYRQRAAQGR